MAVTGSLIQEIGKAVKAVAKGKGSKWWYTPHMAAASRAIAEWVPLIDLFLEVRDARIPLSSKYTQLSKFPSSPRHVIVLNKMDLANRSQTKEWMKFFQEQKCMAFGVNSHNSDNIKEFLTFLQARVRELKKKDDQAYTITLMLVGIPNVGKSALANSLHQVGRIAAAEKGKLKHSIVSPHPGETKTISSLKIASHPNIYVLDTPGVLTPDLVDDEICSKLALTGAINNNVVGEIELAQYFLSILSLSDAYNKWGKLSGFGNGGVLANENISSLDKRQKGQYPTDHTQVHSKCSGAINNNVVGEIELAQYFLSILSLSDAYNKWGKLSGFGNGGVLANENISSLDKRQKGQYPTDHTQDFVVNNVRRALFDAVSSFDGSKENGEELDQLIEQEFEVLMKAFYLPSESKESNYGRVATKLLNLYRTGRLGHYTLDRVPSNAQGLMI